MSQEPMSEELSSAVKSRNRQSNHDTWEINITQIVVGALLALAVVFQVEIHDYLLPILTGGK